MTNLVDERFDFTELTNPGTQLHTLASILQLHIGLPFSKRQLEKLYTLRTAMSREIVFPFRIEIVANNDDELLKEVCKILPNNIPGDVQRQVRTLFERFEQYGLEQSEIEGELMYTWGPKKKSDLELIVHPAARNIFKNEVEREKFIKLKNNKCELCENKKERMAIDHWRAHQIYNVDDIGIAVLLCETCNNIHHNFDASKCLVNNKDNIKYLKNWVKTEKRVRELGHIPNAEDLLMQQQNVQLVVDYHANLNPIQSSFWEELI